MERLSLAARDLPPKRAAIAQFIVDNAFEAATSPVRRLAKRSGSIPATFTRLAQALGFAGWEELREELVNETRRELTESRQGPYSSRKVVGGGGPGIVTMCLETDMNEVAALDTTQMGRAAAVLEQASRVKIAGFRSCHSPASLFYYLYSLFRPDVSLIGVSGGVLDLELNGLTRGDVVVVFGFEPYSRDSLLTALAAKEAGCEIVAIVDSATCQIAEHATVKLLFGTSSPSYFPSLIACIALIQALAALLYVRAGDAGRERLSEAERRIERHSQYFTSASKEKNE